jgi:hypothetical protein
MSIQKRRLMPAVIACAVGMSIGIARADDADTDQAMQQKIDQLEAKVKTLETAEAQNQADVTAAIQHVLADADSHSQMLGSVSVGSGYDQATGFHLGSDDGNFYLHPFALFQFRGAGEYRDAVAPGDTGADVPTTGSHSQSGFEIRRLKLGVDGHVFSPDLSYFLQFDTFRSGGAVTLDDAYVTYRLSEESPFSVRGGQFDDFAWHESAVDDGHQLAAERSLVTALIGGSTPGFGNDVDRVQGISAIYQQHAIHAQLAFHDGYNSQNTKFFNVSTAPGVLPPSDFGFTARAEYKILGDNEAWSEYDQFSSLNAKSELLVVGGGFDWTEARSNDVVFWDLDAQYNNPNGLSAYGAFLGQHTGVRQAGLLIPTGSYNSYGYLVQAEYMIKDKYEPFLRYDFTHLDGAIGTAIDGTEHNVHEITVGVNYYLYGQNAKVTLDGSWLPNGSPVDADGLGILKDDGHSELVARLQFQLQI